jgi:hypothetical protein
MRRLILLVLLASGNALAADLESEFPKPPPDYLQLRFDEDYSYLSDPAERTDPFDSLKYIPLRVDDPSWYLSLGGEVRERVEDYSHPDFGFSGSDNAYLLQRITLDADFHFGDRVRLFVEGISGLIWGQREQVPPPVDDDPIDLQFAFIDLVPWLDDDQSLTLRVGRFGLSLGSGRLVATRAAPNIPFSFDGAQLIFDRPDWHATAFAARPVEQRTYGFDEDSRGSDFWGAYLTHWLDSSHHTGADLYYLGLREENDVFASGIGTAVRHSIGTRVFGVAHGWDWDAEAVDQFGGFNHEDIRAWTGSINTGYTWVAVPWQPRLGMKFDVASGSGNAHGGTLGTFDPLFFKSGYFNDASLLRPSNLIDLHPTWTVQPAKAVEINGGVDVVWRYSTQDALYNPPGGIEIPASPNNHSRYAGTALDVNLDWRLQRHAMLSASYVYFFTGDYIKSAGGGSVGYFSATFTLEF